MKKEQVIDLIDHFGTFASEFPNADLADFGLWLYHQRPANHPDTSELSSLSLELKLGRLLWRFNRFTRFYTRKSFADLSITTIDEFTMLFKVAQLGSASKNEIYNAMIYDTPTGAQMLKRLLEIGLFSEEPDENDRRVKRVRLTEKGNQLYRDAFERLGPELLLKFGNMTLAEKELLLDIFTRLDAFHTEVYFNDSDLSIPELVQKKLHPKPSPD